MCFGSDALQEKFKFRLPFNDVNYCIRFSVNIILILCVKDFCV